MVVKKIFGMSYDIGIDGNVGLTSSKSFLPKSAIGQGCTIDFYNKFNISQKEVKIFDKLYQKLLKIINSNPVKRVDINNNSVKDILIDSEELYSKLSDDSSDYFIVLKEWLDKYDDYDIGQKGDKKKYSLYLKDGEIYIRKRSSVTKKIDTNGTATKFSIYNLFSGIKN